LQEKFDIILKKLFAIGINDERILQGVIALLYDKAITERHFCNMYAPPPPLLQYHTRVMSTHCATMHSRSPHSPHLSPGTCRYARACRVLHENLQAVEEQSGEDSEKDEKKKVSFKRILLTRCQEEFERDLDQPVEGESETEKERRMDEAMKRGMGNVTFVGELFKFELLTERCVMSVYGNYVRIW